MPHQKVQLRCISFWVNLENEIKKVKSTWKLSCRMRILERVGLLQFLKNVHCRGPKPGVSSEKFCLKINPLEKKTLAKIQFLISLTLIVVLAVF